MKTLIHGLIGVAFLLVGLFFPYLARSDEEIPKGKLLHGMAVSVGRDILHIPDDGDDGDAIFLEYMGRFHKTKWGFNAYLGRTINPDVWAIGGEPTFRWKRGTFGIGLVMLDERTKVSGTKWNFSLIACGEITSILDVCWRHWSHGGSLGIRDGTTNRGWNLVLVRLKTGDPSKRTPKIFSENRWYVGVGLGQSSADLGFDERIQEIITEEGFQDEIALLASVGAPLQLSNGFGNYGFKIFAGYRFGNKRRWAFEIAYASLGTYEAEVKTTIDINEFATVTIDGIPIEGDVVADGFASFQGSAKLHALSASFIYTIPISKRVSFFPRFGLAHMVGDVQAREVLSYSYTVDGTTEGIPVIMSDRDAETSVSNSVFRAKIIPLIGAGLNIAATKKYTVRIEYERYGHPTGDPAISVWTISGMRRF